MYKNIGGLKTWFLDDTSFLKELPIICKNFDIDKSKLKFYSQMDEDKYILQYILKEKITDGTFLEIGGLDGILYSNTKTLEDYFYQIMRKKLMIG